MSVLDSLIFDRTASDVARVKTLKKKYLDGTITQAETTEFLSGMKGAYNATDLNRVGQAVAYVSMLLNNYNHPVSVSPKTDWTTSDIPTQAQANTFLQNLSALKAADGTVNIAIPATLNSLNYTAANNIERLLYVIGKKYEPSLLSLPRLEYNLSRPTIGTRG